MSTKYCRHIKATGRRCGCPALQSKPYCYFHDRSRLRHHAPTAQPEEVILHPMRADALGQAEPIAASTPQQPLVLDFPPLEDRESIQVAASMIVAALGRNRLDGKRAATMLYGLQVAAAVSKRDLPEDRSYFVVTDPVSTADGADLSPDEDPAELTDAA